jgi:hypothetical protein
VVLRTYEPITLVIICIFKPMRYLASFRSNTPDKFWGWVPTPKLRGRGGWSHIESRACERSGKRSGGGRKSSERERSGELKRRKTTERERSDRGAESEPNCSLIFRSNLSFYLSPGCDFWLKPVGEQSEVTIPLPLPRNGCTHCG